MKKILPVIGLLIITVVVSCSKETTNNNGTTPPPAANCNNVAAKFIADVNPIIQTNCATGSGCHGNGSGNGPGALTGFSQIKSAAASIKSAVQSKRMPKGGSLTAAQIASIACWADAGAPNN